MRGGQRAGDDPLSCRGLSAVAASGMGCTWFAASLQRQCGV